MFELVAVAIACLCLGVIIGFVVGSIFIYRQLVGAIMQGLDIAKTVQKIAGGGGGRRSGGLRGLLETGMQLVQLMGQQQPKKPPG